MPHRMLSSLVVGAMAAVVGCGATAGPPLEIEPWAGFDDWYFPATPAYVYEVRGAGMGHELDADDFSLVTWPQMEPVAAVAEELHLEPDDARDYDGRHVIRVVPADPLDTIWYALRWSGPELSGNTTLDGVPLADGSVVWRFDGGFEPQLHSARYATDSDVEGAVFLHFSEHVHALPCDEPAAVVSVIQGEMTWERECGEEEVQLDSLLAIPSHGLDPDAPFRVVVRGESVAIADGRLIPAVDVSGTRSITLPRRRVVPPVPTAMCAGVACE